VNAKQPQHPGGKGQHSILMRYAGMGLELAGSIVGLTLAGLWIDHAFDTKPIWLLIGVGVGTVGGLYNLIRAAIRMTSETSHGKPTDQKCKDNDRHDGP